MKLINTKSRIQVYFDFDELRRDFINDTIQVNIDYN